jgi:septal ring factor EnvC (AmiA/AmiB activator)
MVREAWTDERLDDLKEHMDRGFVEVKDEIREVRVESRSTRAEQKQEIADTRTELKAEIAAARTEIGDLRDTMNAKFDRLTYTLIAALIGLLATHYLG